jgi:hypothetical protein
MRMKCRTRRLVTTKARGRADWDSQALEAISRLCRTLLAEEVEELGNTMNHEPETRVPHLT